MSVSAPPCPSLSCSPALPCLALAGPTASGKTAAALALAQALAQRGQAMEIISVDSALVYRGMDVGTAKPSLAERTAVPHHLIDILDPLQSYSAAQFVRDATRLVAEIRARAAVPVLVGGTMLYFKALFEGLHELPGANPAVRAQLDAQAQALGWPAMHAQLARIDPVTAARLAPGDSQRIQRALEVWHTTGQTLAELHATKKEAACACPVSPGAFFSLEPNERSWLHERIGQRFDLMLHEGLLAEVQALRTRGDLHLDLPSMRCVGYRQTWEALAHAETHGAVLDVAALRERCAAATRQLAKRQITWLRSMPQRTVIACDAPNALTQWLQAALALVPPAA